MRGSAASMGGSTYSHLTQPNATVQDKINGCENDVPHGYSRRQLADLPRSVAQRTFGRRDLGRRP